MSWIRVILVRLDKHFWTSSNNQNITPLKPFKKKKFKSLIALILSHFKVFGIPKTKSLQHFKDFYLVWVILCFSVLCRYLIGAKISSRLHHSFLYLNPILLNSKNKNDKLPFSRENNNAILWMGKKIENKWNPALSLASSFLDQSTVDYFELSRQLGLQPWLCPTDLRRSLNYTRSNRFMIWDSISAHKGQRLHIAI